MDCQDNYLLQIPPELLNLVTGKLLFGHAYRLYATGSKELRNVLTNRGGVQSIQMSYYKDSSNLAQVFEKLVPRFCNLRDLHLPTGMCYDTLVGLYMLPECLEKLEIDYSHDTFWGPFVKPSEGLDARTLERIALRKQFTGFPMGKMYPNLKHFKLVLTQHPNNQEYPLLPSTLTTLELAGTSYWTNVLSQYLPPHLTHLTITEVCRLDINFLDLFPESLTFLAIPTLLLKALDGSHALSIPPSLAMKHYRLKTLEIRSFCTGHWDYESFRHLPRQLESLEYFGCWDSSMSAYIPLALTSLRIHSYGISNHSKATMSHLTNLKFFNSDLIPKNSNHFPSSLQSLVLGPNHPGSTLLARSIQDLPPYLTAFEYRKPLPAADFAKLPKTILKLILYNTNLLTDELILQLSPKLRILSCTNHEGAVTAAGLFALPPHITSCDIGAVNISDVCIERMLPFMIKDQIRVITDTVLEFMLSNYCLQGYKVKDLNGNIHILAQQYKSFVTPICL